MASEELIDLLNKSIARELQVTIQYMWQHVQWAGPEHYAVADKFQEIAVQEMKHAEKIGERLWYLNGTPTTKPTEITVGGDLWEMVDNDIKAELEAIELYRKVISVAKSEGDTTTKFIFEGILEQEEDHHDFFTSLKEGKMK